jgi:hypothetical protein
MIRLKRKWTRKCNYLNLFLIKKIIVLNEKGDLMGLSVHPHHHQGNLIAKQKRD